MSDGWHKIGGKWYYYHAGARQFGARYIDGKWYYFDGSEDGAMVTNGFGGSFYYGSTGVRATYTGWKKIDGYWIYFDEDYSVHSGWIKSGSGWYYTDYIYDEDREQMYYAMIANKAVVYNDQLYCFNSSGYCAGAVTGTGWTSCGGVWYYTESGSVVSDSYYQIGKDFYYFNYEGEMITNDIGYVKAAAGRGQMYFGADGKAVKTAGWKQTEYGWIYIGANGFLYQHGIYRIGGKDYSFCDCIWVQ
jgi:glucan-binding YG repeat protein